MQKFQSTPPHGGRLGVIEENPYDRVFQSTPPHGGRPWRQSTGSPSRRFNPRPRMGGDSSPRSTATSTCVSIHAPAWGATMAIREDHDITAFQSTPPHGGRRNRQRGKTPLGCFNPRPRMGGDGKEAQIWMAIEVSIHAPAWGATRASCLIS